MQIIKTFFAFILIAVLAAGGYYYLANRGIVPADKVAQVQGVVEGIQSWPIAKQITKPLEGIKLTPQLPTLGEVTSTVQQVPQLSSVANQSGEVLGSSVQIETQNPPLPQRVFEYGRYTYCQEVVKDYESRYPE